MNSLSFQAERCRHWLEDNALPVWSQTLINDQSIFSEGIHNNGELYNQSLVRFRVQPRQIYVFSHATIMGLVEEKSLVNNVVTQGLSHYGDPDGGFKFALGSSNSDKKYSQCNLYEQAFALLGYAWHYRLSGDDISLDNMNSIYACIEESFTDSDFNGFYSTKGEAGEKGQNPHMHLFEAVMVAYEHTDDTAWLERVNKLYQLFNEHFLQADHLAEFFCRDLSLVPEIGTHVDPGHHYEWVWLLSHYQKLTNTDVSVSINTLIRFAQEYGHNSNGLVRDEVLSSGEPLRSTSRLWCQTEYLKAMIALWEKDPSAIRQAAICTAVEQIFKYYIDPAKRGLWVDQVDHSGNPIQLHSPASTLYHLFLAFSELLRITSKEVK